MPRLALRLAAVLLLALPLTARAQLNALDPDAAPPKRAVPSDLADENSDPSDDSADEPQRPAPKSNLDTLDPDARPRARPPADEPAPPPPTKKKGPAGKLPEPAPEPVGPKAPPLLITRATDADLEAAWDAWRRADLANDRKAEADARAALKALQAELGASALEPFSMGLVRASRAHEKAGDAAGAIELALAAVELSPELPSAHFGLARAYLETDPATVGRWASAFQTAMVKAAGDARWRRPMLADLGSGFLYALVATAIAVVAVLFLRRARYFLYDLHWLFPRAVARWQSTTVGVLLLITPIIFRMGVVPALLVLFAAAALYLSTVERVVAAVCIALLGGVPFAAGALVDATAFSGTPAERVLAVDQGGPGAEVHAQALAKLAAENQAAFAELAALGSFEARRGKLDLAIVHLRAALEKKQNDPRATNNLAAAMFLSGDLENPRALLAAAARADPRLAAPSYNLSRVVQRRVATFGDAAAGEVDQGNSALSEARRRDPSLADRPEPPADKLQGNRVVLFAPLSAASVLALARVPAADERVQSQFTQTLLGDVPEALAPFYPLVAALLLVALGLLAPSIEAARACNKCGRPVSQREDKELSKASQMCTQCINVFARKGVVPPSLKVRKQLEVEHHQQRLGRLTKLLGALCSGMGHVFAGLPVRGALYGFLFLFAAVVMLQRDGVLRVLYEGAPLLFKLVPAGLVLVLVWGLSLRGLFRRPV